MKKIASLLACLSLTALAQTEQQPQPPQGQYYYPPQEQQYQYPPQQQPQQAYQQPQVYQQPQMDNKDQLLRIKFLINDGLVKNKEEIQKISLNLSYADKDALYKKSRYKAAGGWAALNFFVPFGIGSYIQGDVSGGVTQSILDVAGGVLMIVAANIGSETEVERPCASYGSNGSCLSYEYHEREKKNTGFTVSMIAGGVLLGASHIMGIIFPFTHQSKYNKELESALNISNVSYSIDPLIVPKDGLPAVGLAFNLRY